MQESSGSSSKLADIAEAWRQELNKRETPISREDLVKEVIEPLIEPTLRVALEHVHAIHGAFEPVMIQRADVLKETADFPVYNGQHGPELSLSIKDGEKGVSRVCIIVPDPRMDQRFSEYALVNLEDYCAQNNVSPETKQKMLDNSVNGHCFIQLDEDSNNIPIQPHDIYPLGNKLKSITRSAAREDLIMDRIVYNNSLTNQQKKDTLRNQVEANLQRLNNMSDNFVEIAEKELRNFQASYSSNEAAPPPPIEPF